ncbi:MAG: hypothetical protein ABI042_00195 [Verrucomicrobiota bacterium]
MNALKLAGIFLASVIAQSSPAQNAESLKIQIGDVKDTRTTGKFFAGLDVDLKFIGDLMDSAERIKVIPSQAIDETGKNLIDPEKKSDSFNKIGQSSGQKNFTLKLRNPARRANSIKELSGEVQIFAPSLDADSVVTITNVASNATALPLENKSLKTAGAELSILNRAQYDELKSKRNPAVGIEQLFSAFIPTHPNGLAILVKDPQARIIGFEAIDAKGKTLFVPRTWKDDLSIYDVSKGLDPEMSVRILLGTPKSLVKVPFKFTDIALP